MLSQRMSAYVSMRQRMRGEASGGLRCSRSVCQHTSAYVSIRQHTSAYERRGEWRLEMLSQRMPAYVSIHQGMRREAILNSSRCTVVSRAKS